MQQSIYISGVIKITLDGSQKKLGNSNNFMGEILASNAICAHSALSKQ